MVLATQLVLSAFHLVGVSSDAPATFNVAVVVVQDLEQATDDGDLPDVGTKPRPKSIVRPGLVHGPGVDLNPVPHLGEKAKG